MAPARLRRRRSGLQPHIPYLRELIVFLAAAGLVMPVVRRLKISPVLGFLCIGLAIGPSGLGRFVSDVPAIGHFVVLDVEGVRTIAEFGVVFLLFTIGLELSLSQLWAMRRLVFGLGAAQVVIGGAAIGGIAYAFGHSLPAATILGLCLALSSTAVVIQLLTERLQLSAPVGRVSFGVLLFQDLAVVPILFLVSVLGSQTEGTVVEAGLQAFARALLVIVAIMAVGRVIVRPLLRFVGGAGSRELFMAAVLVLILGTAVLTGFAGLSMALGAFLAGLLFAGTEYRHQINSDIEPFKGLFLGLFFISVGMSLDLAAVWTDLPWVALSVFGLVLVKSAILFGVALAFRLPLPVAVESSLLLGQGGEFAFVVVAAAMAVDLLAPQGAQFVLLVVIITMFLTPLLARIGRTLASGLAERLGGEAQRAALPDAEGHVVIGGFGRVGQMLGRLLESQRIPYVALDTDPELVAALRADGAPVFFGDASHPDVLAHLGMDGALAFATTMDEPGRGEWIVATVNRTWPHLPIFARARDPAHAQRLRACGAAGVVPETTEASLQLGENLLVGVGIPEDAARRIVDEQRSALSAAR
jgi:monovalent cation:proton antiporter-2 (CPA2) family protein